VEVSIAMVGVISGRVVILEFDVHGSSMTGTIPPDPPKPDTQKRESTRNGKKREANRRAGHRLRENRDGMR
jgi:hypothetical protein